MILVTDRVWPPETQDALRLEAEEIGAGQHWIDAEADDEQRYGDRDISSPRRYPVVVYETPQWVIVAEPGTATTMIGNGPDSDSYEVWHHEARSLSRDRGDVTPRLNTGKIIDSDQAMALVALLDAGFHPDASWLCMESMSGDMLCVFDAIRRVDNIPDGDEAALLAAVARRMIADAAKHPHIHYASGSKKPHTLVHGGALYLYRPQSGEEFVIGPDGEWRLVERHMTDPYPWRWQPATSPLPEAVAKMWIELGCPSAAMLLGNAPQSMVGQHEDLPTLCHHILNGINLPSTNRDVALVALKIALSENWPQARREPG